MSVLSAAVPARRPRDAARAHGGVREIRIGLLGFGTVGQAVARAAAAPPAAGVCFSIACALVRDASRTRRAPRVARVTTNVEAFLRGRYDVVIDALPGRDAAAAIVARALGRGTPVVSANKALIAAEGPRLRRIAARAGTTLRIEAAVIAGVPFLGALERRPFAGRATRVTGVLNATSHFVATRVAAGQPFDAAVEEARRLGYAAPDASADLQGRDAREKLIVLADLLLGAALDAQAIPLDGIADLTPRDLAAAARLGGVVKPVARAERAHGGVAAFVAPAWLPAAHPLASTTGRDNGVLIEGRHVDRLFFAGPGAGPEVTAATLLDDAVEAALGGEVAALARPASVAAAVTPSQTGWFLRVRGETAGVRERLESALDAGGLQARADHEGSDAWVVVGTAAEPRVDACCDRLRARGAAVRKWRALHD